MSEPVFSTEELASVLDALLEKKFGWLRELAAYTRGADAVHVEMLDLFREVIHNQAVLNHRLEEIASAAGIPLDPTIDDAGDPSPIVVVSAGAGIGGRL